MEREREREYVYFPEESSDAFRQREREAQWSRWAARFKLQKQAPGQAACTDD